MKPKDFKVIKSENDFKRNYSLHDIAQSYGEKILKDFGFKVESFGEDRRYEEVWEAGEDKPDCIIVDEENKKVFLLDWTLMMKKNFYYRIQKLKD